MLSIGLATQFVEAALEEATLGVGRGELEGSAMIVRQSIRGRPRRRSRAARVACRR